MDKSHLSSLSFGRMGKTHPKCFCRLSAVTGVDGCFCVTMEKSYFASEFSDLKDLS